MQPAQSHPHAEREVVRTGLLAESCHKPAFRGFPVPIFLPNGRRYPERPPTPTLCFTGAAPTEELGRLGHRLLRTTSVAWRCHQESHCKASCQLAACPSPKSFLHEPSLAIAVLRDATKSVVTPVGHNKQALVNPKQKEGQWPRQSPLYPIPVA